MSDFDPPKPFNPDEEDDEWITSIIEIQEALFRPWLLQFPTDDPNGHIRLYNSLIRLFTSSYVLGFLIEADKSFGQRLVDRFDSPRAAIAYMVSLFSLPYLPPPTTNPEKLEKAMEELIDDIDAHNQEPSIDINELLETLKIEEAQNEILDQRLAALTDLLYYALYVVLEKLKNSGIAVDDDTFWTTCVNIIKSEAPQIVSYLNL